jgi:hypothetical protein
MSPIFTARPTRPRWHVPAAVALVLATVLAGLVDTTAPARASSHSIAGLVFEDHNRDGAHQDGEDGWSGLVLYLFDADRTTYLGNALTDDNGRYEFRGLAAGSYVVELRASDWWEVWDDWVPTTTGSLQPRMLVDVNGNVVADLGWRRIVRSDTPLTEFVGGTGVRVASHNDVVTAEDVHALLLEGDLVTDEASHVSITHDRPGTITACSISVVQRGDVYDDYAASCNIAWRSWLTGAARSLFHEYGHAWSLYHAYITQQDPALTDYLEIRGLLGDDRLDTSHAWSRREIIAEDYRQLFGSPQARQAPQENRDIPRAADVPDLREYLRDAFTVPATTGASDDDGEESVPEPAPTTDEAPSTLEALRIATPTDGDAITGTFLVEVEVTFSGDAPGGIEVQVTLGSRIEAMAAWDEDRQLFVASVDPKNLRGSQVLRVTATDAVGGDAVDEITVELVRSSGGGSGQSSRGRK